MFLFIANGAVTSRKPEVKRREWCFDTSNK